jgi:hypothetical protein
MGFLKNHFSIYSRIFQLFDSGQFLLMKERTQIHCTVYLGREHQLSTNKLTNFLTVMVVMI